MCKENHPCYGCERRCVTSSFNCHSNCPDYKAYQDKLAERSAIIRKKKAEEHDYDDMKIRSVNKNTGKLHKQNLWKG